MVSTPALLLRIVHGLAAVYFGCCLLYMYYAAVVSRFDIFLLVSMTSLLLEGVAVHLFNNGHCPLIHLQRRLGDDKPFFEIFLPARLARQVIPVISVIALLGAGCVAARYVVSRTVF